MPNLFADLPINLPRELISVLIETDVLRVERIVSTGQASPPDFWYDQERPEWVAVLQGHAILQFDDGERLELCAGDFVNIAAHRRHRVEFTPAGAATVWLAIHYAETRATN